MIVKFSTLLNTLTAAQVEMQKCVEEVKSSQDFISAQYDDIKLCFEKLKTDCGDISAKMSKHDGHLTMLKSAVSDLQKRLRIAEQAAVKNELTINGVPKSLTLSETVIATKIAAAVGVQIYTPDIERTRRAKNGMVEFNNSKVRNDILRARKGKSLYLDEMGFDFAATTGPGTSRSSPNNRSQHTQIFINENLTRDTRTIFRPAKTLRFSHGFKYVWCTKEVIYCKRDDNTDVHFIDTVEDVDKLRSPRKSS